MDRAIAVVSNRKARVYSHDFTTQNWTSLSSSNGYCEIKVLERGRRQYLIQIIDEENRTNFAEYSISEKCEVTKTRSMLQIPATNPNACLLGVQFRDAIEESPFLMRVGEFIPGFKLPLQNMFPEAKPQPPLLPTRLANDDIQRPHPNQGYIKPTMAPHHTTQFPSPDLLPPSAKHRTEFGDVIMRNQPLRNNPHINMEPPRQDFTQRPNDGGRLNDFGGIERERSLNERSQNEGFNRPRQDAWEEQRRDHMTQQEAYPKSLNPGQQRDRMYQPQQNVPVSYRHDNQDYQRDRMFPQQNAHPPHRHDNQEYQRDRMRPPQQAPMSINQNYPSPSMSSMRSSPQADFQMDMNHYTQQLALALSRCDKEESINLVEALASIVSEHREENKSNQGMFSLKYEPDKDTSSTVDFQLGLQIEVFEGESYPLFLTVTQNDTIEQLKLRCWKTFKLPKEGQTWIHGRRIVDNKMCLNDINITEDGDTIFVYVQHPKKVKGMTTNVMNQLKEMGVAPQQPYSNGSSPSLPHHPTVPMSSLQPAQPSPIGGYPLEPMDDRPNVRNKLPAQDLPRDIQPGIPTQIKEHPVLPVQQQPPHGGGGAGGQAFYRGDIGEDPPIIPPVKQPIGGIRVMPAEVPRLQQPQDDPIQEPLPPPPPLAPPPGWDCPACTYHNEPYRPGCFMCNGICPEDYVPPIDYVLTEEEKKFVDETKQQDLLLQQMFKKEQDQLKETATKNYNNLIKTEDQPIVTNNEIFDCPVCFTDIEPGEGITLRSCLHQVCKECLRESITNSEHVQVLCPFADDDYQCDELISEREIRTVLNDQEMDALYNRGLRQAEAAARDSFHCKTIDCPGFCFYVDEVNEYKCPICNRLNCILCKAQHEDMNCQEYQDDLKIKATNDVAAKQTQDMLDKMVADGEAMNCPQCRVIVTKKVGCDWIKCTVCRTEMCWATKGPRWGPKGRGDTTGGCKCGLNRKRCHPNCRNCH